MAFKPIQSRPAQRWGTVRPCVNGDTYIHWPLWPQSRVIRIPARFAGHEDEYCIAFEKGFWGHPLTSSPSDVQLAGHEAGRSAKGAKQEAKL